MDKMKLELFTPEMFKYGLDLIPQLSREGIKNSAYVANKILNEYLAREGVKVYGVIQDDNEHYFTLDKDEYDTHQALLICIEPIKKEKCEHYVKNSPYISINDIQECHKCGVKLKAEWKEVNE